MSVMSVMPTTGASSFVSFEKALGKNFASERLLKTWAIVNCQERSEPAQETTIMPITTLPTVPLNIVAKTSPKGAVDWTSFRVADDARGDVGREDVDGRDAERGAQ